MGIKNLIKFIIKYTPNAIKTKSISDYKNKKIGFDAANYIHKSILAIRINGYDIKNEDLYVTHIHSLLVKIIKLYKFNIKAIFVFDGEQPKIKIEDKYKNKKKEIKKKYKTMSDQEKKKYYHIKYGVTTKEINECKELLELCGITILNASGEADVICAELSKKNIVSYVVTDDTDILMFGGKNILKNFSVDEKKKIFQINLLQILKNIKLTYRQFVDLCLLLGSSYTENSYNINIYEKLLKYKNIKNLTKQKKIKNITNYKEITSYILNPGNDKLEIKKQKIDYERLNNFLLKFKFKNEYINNVINLLKKYKNN